MLQGMAAATFFPLPYLALMSPATFSQASALRLDTTTLAPCSAMRWAIASPMPLVDPVMSATFPDRSKRFIPHLVSFGYEFRHLEQGRGAGPNCALLPSAGSWTGGL